MSILRREVINSVCCGFNTVISFSRKKKALQLMITLPTYRDGSRQCWVEQQVGFQTSQANNSQKLQVSISCRSMPPVWKANKMTYKADF